MCVCAFLCVNVWFQTWHENRHLCTSRPGWNFIQHGKIWVPSHPVTTHLPQYPPNSPTTHPLLQPLHFTFLQTSSQPEMAEIFLHNERRKRGQKNRLKAQWRGVSQGWGDNLPLNYSPCLSPAPKPTWSLAEVMIRSWEIYAWDSTCLANDSRGKSSVKVWSWFISLNYKQIKPSVLC